MSIIAERRSFLKGLGLLIDGTLVAESLSSRLLKSDGRPQFALL